MKYILCMALAACAFGVTPLMAEDKNPVVVVDTSSGKIKIELFADKAPITVKNFLSYVSDKHFDNTVFHRVMPGFMIQGGGFSTELSEKDTKAPIKNESTNGLSNERGTIAMARTPDPDSASAQFFINLVNNAGLNRNRSRDGAGYCVFGKVTEGMDVVDKIAAVQTGIKTMKSRNRLGVLEDMPHENVPLANVVIKSVTVEK